MPAESEVKVNGEVKPPTPEKKPEVAPATTPEDAQKVAPPTAPDSTGPSKVQLVKSFFMESIFLQHFLLVPVIVLLSYFFTGIIVWPLTLVGCIFLALRSLKAKKAAVYEKAIADLELDWDTEVQDVNWLNQVIAKFWITCVPALVRPHIEGVSKTLKVNKPPFLYNLDVGKWSFGKKGPRLSQIRTTLEKDMTKYVLDGEILFAPDFSLELKIEPMPKIAARVELTNVVFKGRIRIRLNLNEENPNASILSFCLVGDPKIAFLINPMGSADLIPMSKIYEWISDIVINAIRPMMVWPQKMQFTLGEGEVISEHTIDEPITNIAVIDTDELQEPAGFLILEKALNSGIPANLNQGTEGKNIYLTYQRDPDAKPITGLCIICPSKGDVVPEGFTMLEKTPAGLTASLNAGNSGPEVFLCYTKAPGKPITGLGVMNLSETVSYDTTYTRIESTPSGNLANTNYDTKGHPIYLAYRGGSHSLFGFDKPFVGARSGLLRVLVSEAQDVKAADIGGTSDPYCSFTVGLPDAKKLKKKKTKTIDCTLNPVWEEFFLIPATLDDVVTISVYDKDTVGSDESIGKTQFAISSLVQGREVDQWYPLQHTSSGFLRIKLVAMDFGLDPATAGDDIVPIETIEVKGGGGIFNNIKNSALGNVLGNGGVVKPDQLRKPIKGLKMELKKYVPEETVYQSHKGHMEKLPTNSMLGMNKGWQRRWIVLEGHKVTYYRSHKDSEDNSLGSITLKGAEIYVDENQNEYTLDVQSKAKKLQFRAVNEKEFVEWYKLIATNILVSENEKGRFD